MFRVTLGYQDGRPDDARVVYSLAELDTVLVPDDCFIRNAIQDGSDRRTSTERRVLLNWPEYFDSTVDRRQVDRRAGLVTEGL